MLRVIIKFLSVACGRKDWHHVQCFTLDNTYLQISCHRLLNCNLEDNVYGRLQLKIWCQREWDLPSRLYTHSCTHTMMLLLNLSSHNRYYYVFFRLCFLDAPLVVWLLLYTVMNFEGFSHTLPKWSVSVMQGYFLMRMWLAALFHSMNAFPLLPQDFWSFNFWLMPPLNYRIDVSRGHTIRNFFSGVVGLQVPQHLLFCGHLIDS